jgi:hypothetical protein
VPTGVVLQVEEEAMTCGSVDGCQVGG